MEKEKLNNLEDKNKEISTSNVEFKSDNLENKITANSDDNLNNEEFNEAVTEEKQVNQNSNEVALATETSNVENDSEISNEEDDDFEEIDTSNYKPSLLEKVQNYLRQKKQYCITFGILFGAFLIHLFFNGVLAGNTIIVSDSHEQIVAFFEHFYNVFSGKATLFYSNFYGKGLAMFSTLQYMFTNPFYLIVILGGRKLIVEMFTISVFCMLVFTAFTFIWFTEKYIKNIDRNTRIMFTLMYVFSAFLNFNYSFITWYIYAALILILIDRFLNFIKTGKIASFIAVFVWYVISCYSIGISTAIMLFIVFTIYLLVTQKKENKKKLFTGLCVVFASTALISIALLFPAIIDVFNTGRTDTFMSNVLELKRELSLKKYGFVFGDAGILILAGLYFIKCDKKKKFNIFLIILIPVLYMPVVFDTIMKILCLSRYQGFPARFYFLNEVALFIPAMLFVDKKMLKVNECKTEQISKLLYGLFVSFLLLTILIIEFVSSSSIGQVVKSPTYPGTSISVLNGCFFLMLAFIIAFALFFNYRKILSPYLVRMSFALVLIISLSLNFLTFTSHANNDSEIDKSEITQLIKNNNIKNNVKIFNSEASASLFNFSIGDARRISAFSSLVSGKSLDAYVNLGYNTSPAVVSDFTGSIIADCLNGLKYYISDHEENRPYLSLIDKSENFYLYENTLAGSGAYKFNSDFTFGDGTNFYSHFDKLKEYFEISDELFVEVEVEISSDVEYNEIMNEGEDSKQKITFTAEKDGILYVNAFLAFEEKEKNNGIKNYAISNVDDKYIQDLKYMVAGETYSFYTQKYFEKVDSSNLKFKFLDYSVAEKICQKIKDCSLDYKYTKNGYEVNIDSIDSASNVFVFTPNINGMNYQIDGKDVQVNEALGGMVYFSVSGSENTITAKYKYEYLGHWLICALVAVAIAVAVLVLYHFTKFAKLETVIYYFVLVLFAGLALFTYGVGTVVSFINFFV